MWMPSRIGEMTLFFSVGAWPTVSGCETGVRVGKTLRFHLCS